MLIFRERTESRREGTEVVKMQHRIWLAQAPLRRISRVGSGKNRRLEVDWKDWRVGIGLEKTLFYQNYQTIH
jgi:hypothetical protein